MLVVLSGGGTAGHINPALAVAEKLIERGHEVVFAGTPTGVEARLVPAADIPFKAFEAKGFDRSHLSSLPKALVVLQKSTRLARAWLEEIKPDVVVGFGGYVSIPVGRAAKSLDIPIVVHEQNSVMGMTNKYLAKHAKKLCLTYECAGKGFDASKQVVTGNPVRGSVLSATRKDGRAMLDIPQDANMLLIFGGSLGARHINQAVIALKEKLLAHENLFIEHITGPKELDACKEELALTQEQSRRWNIMGYQDKMGETLAAADMIVSRAGATSLAEISALGIPALLVPFPFATEDHQTMNARTLVDAGCALFVPDDELDTNIFEEKLEELITNEDLRAEMRKAALAQETSNAATRLADEICAAVTK